MRERGYYGDVDAYRMRKRIGPSGEEVVPGLLGELP